MHDGKPSFRYDPKGETVKVYDVGLDPRVIVIASMALVLLAVVLTMAMNGWEVPL